MEASYSGEHTWIQFNVLLGVFYAQASMIGIEIQTTLPWLKATFLVQLDGCVYIHPSKPVRSLWLLLKTKDFFCSSPFSSIIILHDQEEC